MKTIIYECGLFNNPIIYSLVQQMPDESYQLYQGDTLIGSVINVEDKCVQVSGREISSRMLDDIYKLLNL